MSKTKLVLSSNNFPNDVSYYRTIAEAAKVQVKTEADTTVLSSIKGCSIAFVISQFNVTHQFFQKQGHAAFSLSSDTLVLNKNTWSNATMCRLKPLYSKKFSLCYFSI